MNDTRNDLLTYIKKRYDLNEKEALSLLLSNLEYARTLLLIRLLSKELVMILRLLK